jgi:putative phosphoribosyl transferase
MFEDRKAAGRLLASRLEELRPAEPIVLALPRGGVPIGAEVATALGARLDVLIVRKVGAPGNSELAIAAIVDGEPPDVVLNREIIEAYGLDDEEVSALIAAERPELERRRTAFRGTRRAPSLRGHTVILVDDGAATGATMRVAVRAVRRRGPSKVIVALPVAAPEAVAELAREADDVVCLSKPARFMALGYHYRYFPQLEDSEVVDHLDRARRELAARA